MRKDAKRLYIIVIIILLLLSLAACSNAKLTIPKAEGKVASVRLFFPEDEAGEVSVKPFFKWSNDRNINNYTLIIAVDQDFEEVVFTRSTLATSEFKMSSGLYNSTQYFWKVIAYGSGKDNISASDTHSFITQAEELVQEEQVLDDFESYEYVAFLQTEYYAPNGDAAKINLIDNSEQSDFIFSDFFASGKLLEVEYDLHTYKFSNFTRNLHRSLLGTDGISFKVGNLGTSIKIVLDIFEKSGEGFRASATVRGIMPYEVFIPYSDFERHPDAGIPQDGVLQGHI